MKPQKPSSKPLSGQFAQGGRLGGRPQTERGSGVWCTGAPNRAPNRKPRYRAARRQALRDAGQTPVSRVWVWSVQPDALKTMPAWAVASQVKGLGEVPGHVWLWWRDALRLMREDRRAGGQPIATRQELRRCGLCGRPWVGKDAERRRLLDAQGPEGRQQPCGEQCERDRVERVWKRLSRD